MSDDEFRRVAPRLRWALWAAIVVNVLTPVLLIDLGGPPVFAANITAAMLCGVALWILRQRERGRWS